MSEEGGVKHLDNDLESLGGIEPDSEFLKGLEVRTEQKHGMKKVRELLDGEHDLGAAPAMRFIDRDEWIGWTHQQTIERQGLIVRNRRFLVIAEIWMPNLASRALALALRVLPGEWEKRWGGLPGADENIQRIHATHG